VAVVSIPVILKLRAPCAIVVECDDHCHWRSGCSLSGVGKCDKKCTKGRVLRDNQCLKKRGKHRKKGGGKKGGNTSSSGDE